MEYSEKHGERLRGLFGETWERDKDYSGKHGERERIMRGTWIIPRNMAT